MKEIVDFLLNAFSTFITLFFEKLHELIAFLIGVGGGE